MAETYQTPGIYFSSEVPSLDEKLPRMDIAAMVGFAQAGPMHTPVPIEGPQRFREIFGQDFPLARDAETGRWQSTLLGNCVEAFFRNGGLRCWVIRVGDDRASTARFSVPGLWRRSVGNEAEPVWTQARSPGSWADELKIGAVLHAERLAWQPEPGEGPPELDSSGDGESCHLEIRGGAPTLLPGDLLEMSFSSGDDTGTPPTDRRLYLFVHRVRRRADVWRLTCRPGVWAESADLGSPPADWRLTPLHQLEGPAAWELFSPPTPQPVLRRLRFDLLAWRNGAAIGRVRNLAFASSHPRYWGHLPTDEEAFGESAGEPGERPDPETAALLAEALHPRFAFAAGALNRPGDGPRWYLPLGMATQAHETLARAATLDAGSTLERNGLSSFDARLFLDSDLAKLQVGSLLREAEHKCYLRGSRLTGNAARRSNQLKGLHGLLPLEEVTTLALPDAVHRPWKLVAFPPPRVLAAPLLEPFPAVDDEGQYSFRWTVVDEATEYELHLDDSPDFRAPRELYRGDQNVAAVQLSESCRRAFYARVRALREGQIGPWSITRVRMLPDREFRACLEVDPSEGEILLEQFPSASPQVGTRLTWTLLKPGKDTSTAEPEFELQEDASADFVTADQIDLKPGADSHLATAAEFAVRYYRVRVRRDDGRGVWSNTIAVSGDTVWEQALIAPAEFLPNQLLGVHRAALRFCAARGDLMAVLSMPRHYHRRHVVEYLDTLRGDLREASAVGPSDLTTAPVVPPLTVGERYVLSYAAIYHPWLAMVREDAGAEDPRLDAVPFTPPDGTIVGSLAKRTLARGAWWAPANELLSGVLACEPSFDLLDEEALTERQVDLIRRRPDGWLVMNADTLGDEREFRPINVRRLLILLRRLAMREGQTFVFEPNHQDFRDLVRQRFERLLSDMYVRGAFTGRSPQEAYRVVTDDSVNTPQSLDAGRFVVELRVAASRPLSFLRVRLVQSGPEQFLVQES